MDIYTKERIIRIGLHFLIVMSIMTSVEQVRTLKVW